MKKPLYVSRSTVRSLWQEYRIYADRLEFRTLLGTVLIPFDQIERFEVSESDVKRVLKGDLQLRGFRPALKLDWANFVEHVKVDKKKGIRRLQFTPDKPAEFARVLGSALQRFREKASG